MYHFIEFTVSELWLLHAYIRHEVEGADRWSQPPCSEELNEQIGHALYLCTEYDFATYTLALKDHDFYVVDYHIREDMKHPAGGKGKDILLKLFKARADKYFPPLNVKEIEASAYPDTYRDAKENADKNTNPRHGPED